MKSEDIFWKIGETTIGATLTLPDEPGKSVGIVFVAGSGPTDRNWESPLLPGNNGSARLLAERLTAEGYVTLRYDKRVTGSYAKDNMAHLAGKISMESHFEELKSAVSQLIDRPELAPESIYVLTNSEGALHALYYQTHANVLPFSGMILTGAPGRPLSHVANHQVFTQAKALPNADDVIARYKKLIASFEAGKPFVADPNLPEGFNNMVAALSAPFNQPFTREFWAFKPAPYFRNLDVPVLVVIGKKDLQCDWKLDGEALEKEAEVNENVEFFYPDNANHVLKFEPTPREQLTMADAVKNYNLPEAKLDPETVSTIISWLNLQVAR
ncbi:alpha/beta hydrolase family protein [Dehalogenimonas etheniformans]|uniref:Alpha/beta hydrolase n=1 Tax=Dehalogenimonas etheniformans TaxID=1536648 RepID=A0A2P5P6D1_9CHLR|nr:alpha/beta fold hydrolase [Dehalogenimonas etheniformans]PPD57853.1 alpha/beta hydrolase [Dehalogenimonas etheniformans]QNT75496.1 alpha/beta fold hydrolase [Dehalogenimonas etheniformans]